MNAPDQGHAQSSYVLGEEIGSGALARVVEVRDVQSGRRFAGKVLHSSHENDHGATERFARESQVLSGLQHPNIVTVHGLRDIAGCRVLLMELVDGPSLAHMIAGEGPMTNEHLIAVARGIASGLAAAHAQGIIHRDLKPANILMADPRMPKIADFGMARASSFAGIDRDAFAVLGTPDYMAPESLEPLAVDSRSDLYALGCIMYEMATGRPPFPGPTPFAVLERHRGEPVPDLPEHLSIAVRELVARLLEKRPADRPQSAKAVLDLLDRTLDLASPVARLDPTPAIASVGHCVACGSPLVRALSVCLDCGLATPHAEPGDHTVFVTGPGENADKLDSNLRQRLLDWIDRNPNLLVDATSLRKSIPRVPFAFVAAVSARSGHAIAGSLERLGLTIEVVRGGRWSLPAVRRKARTIGGRAMAIVGASTGYMWAQSDHWWSWTILPVALIGSFVVTWGQALRPATRLRSGGKQALPESIDARLQRISTIGASLSGARHREALRAVVTRVLALRQAAGEHDRTEIDHEIGEALDVAMVAAGRLDGLDTDLARADLREPTRETDLALRERDMWSTRLLDLTATLEAFRIRLAAANARRGTDQEAALIDDLRLRIAALEEVQRS